MSLSVDSSGKQCLDAQAADVIYALAHPNGDARIRESSIERRRARCAHFEWLYGGGSGADCRLLHFFGLGARTEATEAAEAFERVRKDP